MIQPTLQEISLKEVHKSFSSKGPVHEDRRLQIEELDEWRTHKPKTPDKPKLRQNKLNTSQNQLKVGDKVLLDAAEPHIVTTTPNEEIPITVLSIFPFGMVEVSHRTFKKSAIPASKKRKGASSSSGPTTKICHPFLQFPNGPQEELFQILRVQPLATGRCINWATVKQLQMADAIWVLLTTDPWKLFFGIIGSTYLELTIELYSTFHLQTVMTRYDDLGTAYIRRNSERRMNYMLSVATYISLPRSAGTLWPLAWPPHTITKRLKSTGIVNTHDVYFLWCMSQGHVIDLAYFIALEIQHQTERHRKGVISITPYVTRLAQHFGLLNTAAMRMIERHQGTYPPQYRLAQSIEEDTYEDISDDAPICQYLHISSPVPPREPSRDEDV
ncbi:hypothetical protein GOBAR_AA19689 [Gossypium barbadense]|uniref:Uncharacterized protein n=1 Tax=Gossypium barbadense TaxID=3634 RepID=A0A2P5XCC3_GOSBA|nr:hypothetical protein GOBAR_AA19689 [Gossypium barbadense]